MSIESITYKLADKQAVNTILDACDAVTLEGVVWRDTEHLRNCTSVQWEVKYLRTRGLLEHHPVVPILVRIKHYD